MNCVPMSRLLMLLPPLVHCRIKCTIKCSRVHDDTTATQWVLYNLLALFPGLYPHLQVNNWVGAWEQDCHNLTLAVNSLVVNDDVFPLPLLLELVDEL